MIARAMWELAGELGFEGGRVLEPGCGAGVFLGLAPAGPEVTGVELDDTTAAIAQALHPDARIISRSLAQSQPRGTFDVTVGNVSFADVRLYDPVHNRQQHTIHNHFIVKSLALTRPRGHVIVLSSRYTLDAANPAARREISGLADPIRLPTGAHRRAAGTDAVTDLLILRRRPAGAEPLSESWINTRTVQLPGGEARVNEHFIEHPDRVLGELQFAHGMHSADTLHVTGELDPREIAQAILGHGRRIAAAAPAVPQRSSERAAVGADELQLVEASEGLWDGHLVMLANGTFAEVKDGLEHPIQTPRTIAAELRALLGLRDRARELLAAEAQSMEDTPRIGELRTRLRADYESYYARYGPINRFTQRRTGRIDPESGEERMARIAPRAITAFRGDPFCPLVMSLEAFDETTQGATPAALLSKRVIVPREPVLGVETAQDALAVCLDTRGHVEIDDIARLLGRSAEDARRALGELVYEDPQDAARLIPAAEYLSGNVRVKLKQARAGAEQNPALAVNVAALERVLPVDLGADEVEPRLGAAWIGVEDHRAFLAEILQDPSVRVEHPGGMVWAVRATNSSVLARSEWGTSRIAAGEIAKAVLEQRPVQVRDELDDGRRVVNPLESAAAQDKANAMQERFVDWCWQDPDRAQRLLREYDRRFNAIVLRDYGPDGERLLLSGIARTLEPMPHQRAPVARMLCEPAVGLFHQVGAGKTAEMCIGVSELRRLGIVRKPAIVVPNMLEQFSREYLQLYPQSRVLAASSGDLAGEKRRRFVARAAGNDWDAIILTRSTFERIPVTPETQARYMEKELAEMRAMLANAQAAGGLTVKRVEKMVLAAEERLSQQLDGEKDPGISFEETGVDYLAIDFTSRPFPVRLVRSRGCGAVWRTRGRGRARVRHGRSLRCGVWGPSSGGAAAAALPFLSRSRCDSRRLVPQARGAPGARPPPHARFHRKCLGCPPGRFSRRWRVPRRGLPEASGVRAVALSEPPSRLGRIPPAAGPKMQRWLMRWGGDPDAGVVFLAGLHPLVAAEIRYSLWTHTKNTAPARWHPMWLRRLVKSCREGGVQSLLELDPNDPAWTPQPAAVNRIVREMLKDVQPIHRTRADTRELGYLDTNYWGFRFPDRRSSFDLTSIPQRWLRDLTWDYMASELDEPGRPRTQGPFDAARRAIVSFGTYLLDCDVHHGDVPSALSESTAKDFTGDLRARVSSGRPVRGLFRVDGNPSTATATSYPLIMNALRKVMRWAMDSGAAAAGGLSRPFVVAIPYGGAVSFKSPRPFTDVVLRELSDPANIGLLDEMDRNDIGLADIWSIQVQCGRRIGEVVKLRLGCVGEHFGRTWMWVDMTKVGKLDYAVQIPRDVYDLIRARQIKTTERFRLKRGAEPTAKQQRALALFPSPVTNPTFERSISASAFSVSFRAWLELDAINLPGHTTHQARHTLATRLVNAGASMTHVKRVLGHVSERMSDSYVLIAGSQVEPFLQQIWVTGPGNKKPGAVVRTPTDAERSIAQRLMVDLSDPNRAWPVHLQAGRRRI
ncbi:MAG: tyrosine-type recombinase/integrase [Solirubrobacteraceae bacterium]